MLAAEAGAHPGQMVRRVLSESGLPVTDAAERLRVSRQQLTRLLGRKSAVSPEMALRLESVFGLPAKELLEMQLKYDLEKARQEAKSELAELEPYRGPLSRLNKNYVLGRLRSHEEELRKAGIERLYLFGSLARGEAQPTSDVDLFYERAATARIGLLALQKIQKRIEEILGLKTDLVPGDSFRPLVRAEVERDAIRIF